MSRLAVNQIGGGKIRSSNFELLRIVCMLFIVCGHIIMVHKYEEMGDSSWCINQVTRPFCAVAVNVFVLISGYFGIKYNFRKLLSLNWMVTFYSIVFLAISMYLEIHTFSPMIDWMQFLPVVTKQYWFITIYFVLCIISPYLNLLVEHLDVTKYRKMLLLGCGLFVILPTCGFVLNFRSITEDAGYGIVNFIFLYLLGRYLRLYYTPIINKFWYLTGYVIGMASCGMFQMVFSELLGFSYDSLISYDTLFVFFGALCLFLFFSKIEFKNLLVNNMAKGCLVVYIIHLHPLFYEYFFNNILNVKSYVGVDYIVLLIIAPCLIYLCCILIEKCRSNIFMILKLT